MVLTLEEVIAAYLKLFHCSIDTKEFQHKDIYFPDVVTSGQCLCLSADVGEIVDV